MSVTPEVADAISDVPEPLVKVATQVTEGWSKWDIALCVGAPIALGLAGLWYTKFYRRKPKDDPKPKPFCSKIGDGEGDTVPKTTNVRKDNAAGSPETPNEPQGRQELAQAAKTKGNKLFKEGKYEEAITCYTEAIKICPPNIKGDMSTFYQNRAAAYENQNLYASVIEDCTEALLLNPKYTKALARRSKAYEALNQYRESLEDITKACLLENFQNQAYLQTADRVLKTLGKSRASRENKTKKPVIPSKFFVDNYFAGFVNDPVKLKFQNPGEAYLEGLGVKKKEEADNIGDNGAVLLDKPSAFERAKSSLAAKDYESIIPLCDEELSDPSSTQVEAETLLLKGTMKLLQGLGDDAVEDFGRAGKNESASPRIRATALLREACLLMQRDSSDAAVNKFTQAKTLDPDNSDLYHHHGQQLLQLDMLNDALEQFNKSIKLSPLFPGSYVQKYYALHRKALTTTDGSLVTAASKGFEETIKDFPNCSDALVLYAQTLSDQGKFDDADRYFEKACQVQPENATNLVHRGLMLLQWRGDIEKTLELLAKASKIDPMCPYAYEIRGTIEVQRGHLSEAVKFFKKAIELSISEGEMAHLFSLMEAAEVQVKVAKDLNIQLPAAMV